MANKPGGKMLLIITTCMSVIAAFSLFNNWTTAFAGWYKDSII